MTPEESVLWQAIEELRAAVREFRAGNGDPMQRYIDDLDAGLAAKSRSAVEADLTEDPYAGPHLLDLVDYRTSPFLRQN